MFEKRNFPNTLASALPKEKNKRKKKQAAKKKKRNAPTWEKYRSFGKVEWREKKG